MDPEKSEKFLHLSKKAYQKLSGLFNWNTETTMDDLRKLSWCHVICVVLHFVVIVSAGMASTSKYGCDEDNVLAENDRQFLAMFCVMCGVVGLVQSLVVFTEANRMARQMSLTSTTIGGSRLCHTCHHYRPMPERPTSNGDPLRKYRVLNIVFLLIVAILVAATSNVLCSMDVWNTDFGLILGCYMVIQVVTIALFIRGAFSGLTGQFLPQSPLTVGGISGEAATNVEGQQALLAIVVEENETDESGINNAEPAAKEAVASVTV